MAFWNNENAVMCNKAKHTEYLSMKMVHNILPLTVLIQIHSDQNSNLSHQPVDINT